MSLGIFGFVETTSRFYSTTFCKILIFLIFTRKVNLVQGVPWQGKITKNFQSFLFQVLTLNLTIKPKMHEKTTENLILGQFIRDGRQKV